jgi:phosphoribosylanthranilate isomerase
MDVRAMAAPTAAGTAFDDRLASAALGPRVKVCGIKDAAEIELLAARQVDFAGLWYGVPGGPHDLPFETWRGLAGATAATGTLTPVLVTFLKEVEPIREALDASGVRWVQLHGYPTPGFVRALKELDADVRVIKVLHIRGGKLLEERLLAGYEKSGVDVFLFDVVTDDGRVGSTGQTLDPALVASFAAQLTRPFLLAGGISSRNRADYAAVTALPGFLGVDVDTNARDADGAISADNVDAICGAWKEAGRG